MGQSYIATKFLSTESERMELAQWDIPTSNGSPHAAKPMRFDYSGVFYPKGCFVDDDGDDIYCTGNTLILVFAFINSILFCLLLVHHIKANMRVLTVVQLLTKVKTTILILIVLLQLSVVIRYGFVINNAAIYDAILITSGFVQSIILFQICYFYSKKASHYLEDSKKIRQLMRIVMGAAVVLFLGFTIYQFWDNKVTRASRSGLCKSFYFILPNIIN